MKIEQRHMDMYYYLAGHILHPYLTTSHIRTTSTTRLSMYELSGSIRGEENNHIVLSRKACAWAITGEESLSIPMQPQLWGLHEVYRFDALVANYKFTTEDVAGIIGGKCLNIKYYGVLCDAMSSVHLGFLVTEYYEASQRPGYRRSMCPHCKSIADFAVTAMEAQCARLHRMHRD